MPGAARTEVIVRDRAASGCLADGTEFYAPLGEVVIDGDRIVCHLCGRWLRSVTAHLRAHRWTKTEYCAVFGLERSQSLEGAATRKLRAMAFEARLLFDPAVREGSAAGRARARSGALARDAAAAACGRPLPEQRRRKAMRALAGVSRAAIADANKARATRQIAEIAAQVAGKAGYATIGDLVRARIAQGASLAAISREAGLDKDWLSRHLGALDPLAAAGAALAPRAETAAAPDGTSHQCGADARWTAALLRLGFTDVDSYLRERHSAAHLTVNQIAAEVRMSHHTVQSALRRHGLSVQPHAGTRHAAQLREASAAAALGSASIAEYVAQRRGAGWTWAAIAAESGQPQSWLRRHASARAA